MASLINVRLNRGDASPWGFRLQGGKDFGTPLVIQKVNGNSLAEKGGLQVGDAVIRVNGTDVFNLRHKDAQDIIVRGGNNIEVTVQRGGNATWKPAITPVGPTPTPSAYLPSKPAPVTKTSLAAGRPQGSPSNIGSAHNLAPRPFSNPQVNGEPVKSIVNKQYNSPVNIYSEETIAETLSAQAEVLAGGVLGVNFKKNEKGYDSEKSEVFKMLQEAEREPKSPEPVAETDQSGVVVPPPFVGLRHVSAPEPKPSAPSTPSAGSTAGGQNLCAECERLIVPASTFFSTHSHATGGRAVSPRPMTPLAQQMSLPPQTTPYMPQTAPAEAPKCSECSKFIVGVFVRIKDKNLHVECFKCATCGTSLKNVGYYNINNKLYCDIHAKLVARQNPPAPNLEPIAIPPGGRAPAGTISAALAATTAPSTGPQSPQPSTIAPLPFHAPRLGPTHVTPPKPITQQQSSPSATATTGPKPFGSVSAPAPYQPPPVAPPAPAAPFLTKQQPALTPSNKFMWPPNQDDTQPAATATPLYIPPTSVSESAAPVEKSVPELTSPDDRPCCIDQNKRMSICSEEICELSEQKKKSLKSDNLFSLPEESGDRPESPIPFGNQESSSVEATPNQEFKSFDVSLQNLNVEEKSTSSSVTQNVSAESLQMSAQQAASSSENVDTTVEGNVTRTRKTKVEESYSQSSTSYSSVRSSKTISRCITPEICEIMEKPRGSPSLFQMDRPATPQQVVVFPPEIPAFVPLPRSRAGTPQPHALQRILSEELGLRPQQPPVPPEEIEAEKAEALKSSEELFTQTQVNAIVQKELEKYKNGGNPIKKPEQEIKPPEQPNVTERIVDAKEEVVKQEEKSLVQSATATIQRYESSNTEQIQSSSIQSNQIQIKQDVQQDRIKEKEEIVTQQLETSSVDLKRSSTLAKREQRPYSPVQPPQAIVRPKPQPVPLPAETQPYYPPPPPSDSETTEKPVRPSRELACQSPMVAALTTAPNRPYSPLPVPTFKPISLDDLPPPPPQGSQPISLLAALTIAPDSPYTPFPDPVDVSKQSPPKFFKDPQKEVSKPTYPKPVETVTATSVTTQQAETYSTKQRKESAFKPVVQKPQIQTQPQPLPLPDTVKTSQSVPSKAFPPVTDELKSTFKPKVQGQNVPQPVPVIQNLTISNNPPGRVSPSGLRKTELLPYYQQNIGEIPLAHRAKSPVPHAIKAPTERGAVIEPKRTVSEQIKSSTTSYASNKGYVASSVFGQTFTSTKSEVKSSESSEKLLPYYQQNIGEIPLAHRPKSPVPHAIKAPTIEPVHPARPLSATIKPSPLAGKAPETLSKTKQIFKPESSIQNVFAAPPEPKKTLNRTLPHFSSSPASSEPSTGGAPWIVKKQNESSTQPKPQFKLPDFKAGAASSKLPSSQPSQKPAAGFTPPSQNKPPGPSITSDPPAGAGGPGNKSATFAGSTAPRRGRGTLNPSVGPGARIPLCGSCNRQIRGPFITALGKIWCPEHFMCANAQCRRPLQDIGFVEESTGLYCEFCFEQYLAPVCSKCNAKIKGDCLNAIGKHFHPECFCCAYCGKLFGNSPFFLEDALPYCESDWNELFTTKCFSCGFPIEAGDRWVEALSNNYHSQCFNCTMCKKNLEGQSFYAKGGRPFCKNHAR